MNQGIKKIIHDFYSNKKKSLSGAKFTVLFDKIIKGQSLMKNRKFTFI